jgi:hypothetical protein
VDLALFEEVLDRLEEETLACFRKECEGTPIEGHLNRGAVTDAKIALDVLAH